MFICLLIIDQFDLPNIYKSFRGGRSNVNCPEKLTLFPVVKNKHLKTRNTKKTASSIGFVFFLILKFTLGQRY